MRPITESKFLTDDERERLNCTFKKYPVHRDTLLLQLILLTGARSCEALRLRVEDFAWKQCTVTIPGAKHSDNRTLPLPAEFCRRMQAFAGRGKGLLFPISTRQLRYIWDQYRPVPTKGIHCLRHTAGILLYLKCRDILVVKSFLGHRSISNTMVYLNFVMGTRMLKQAMKGMWQGKVMG